MTVTPPDQADTVNEPNDDDVTVGEVVDDPSTPEPDPGDPPTPGASVVMHDGGTDVELPPVPTHSEFMVLAMQAKVLSQSEIAPRAFQGNPAVAFHVGLIGRDLGLPLSSAIELIDVIDGRPSLSPQLRSGQVKRRGLGSIVPWVRTNERCLVYAVGPGGMDRRCVRNHDHVDDCRCDILGETEFTWEDAQIAGLVRDDCEPTRHSEACVTASKSSDWNRRKAACKSNWRTYPKRMLQWRATGFCADDYFPDSSLGLYSADEIGAVTDADGNVIDVESVELPYQFGDDDTAPTEVETVDEATAELLRARANALPGPAIREFKGMLREREITGFPIDLPSAKVRLVEALLSGLEVRASDGDWGPWTPPEPATPTDDTPSGTTDPAAAETVADTPTSEAGDDGIEEAVLVCEVCGEGPCVCDAAAAALPADGPDDRIARIASNVDMMTDEDYECLDDGDLFDLAVYVGADVNPGMERDAITAAVMATAPAGDDDARPFDA